MSRELNFEVPFSGAFGFSIGTIGGLLAINISIFTLNFNLWLIVLINSLLIIFALLYIIFHLYSQGTKINRKLQNKIEEFDDLNKRHNALSQRFDVITREREDLKQYCLIQERITNVYQDVLDRNKSVSDEELQLLQGIEEIGKIERDEQYEDRVSSSQDY